MWKLAIKNTFRRKGQSILTIIITTLTILTFVLVFSVFLVMQKGVELTGSRLGADVMVLPDKAKSDAYETLFTGDPINVYMNSDILNKISKVDGVEKISPQFFTQTLEEGCCSYGEAIRLVGYDKETDFMIKPWFNNKNINELKDDEVIIGSNVEAFLGFKVAILGEPFKVVGNLYPTGSGIDDTIYMNISVARKLAGGIDELKPMWGNKSPDNLISTIFIKAKQGVSPETIVKNIKDMNLGVEAVSTSETIGSIKSQIGVISKVIFGLWIALLLVASLGLFGRFNSLAKERKKEIGLLRAIGIQKYQVVKLILTEAWIMAGIGGVLGSILGSIFVIPLLNILRKSLTLPSTVWSIETALICTALGVLMALLLGLIASIYPALKAGSLEPKEAITQGELS